MEMESEVGSSSSNIISSTQDNNFSSIVRYQNQEQSTGFNDSANQQNQFFNASLSLMTNNSSSSSSNNSQPIRTLRPHSTPATLIWLEDNYELAEGVCIPRSVLYLHYVDFCANNHVQPVNAASFGKIIRQQFPQLTTRRLGTRGQSRYHYYGIAIRETSAYYQSSYSKKSGQKFQCSKTFLLFLLSNNDSNVDPLKREARENITKQPISTVINSRTRTATMLPQFPNLKDFILPNNLDKDKISTFLMMYRTHCQRILDTIIRANFDEVQTFLLHFWQGVPPHLSPILESNSVVNLIGVCDSILYKTIANVLLPSVLQTLPESLTKMMRQFAADLDTWLRMSLFNLPETLRSVKLELSRRFGQVLKRQTSLNHLSQASRMVVNNNEITIQMLRDWRLIDVQTICREIIYDSDHINDSNSITDEDRRQFSNSIIDLIRNFCQQFERLLEEEAQIENYLEWLESIVHKCVLSPSVKSSNASAIRRLSRQFLLLWSAFGSRVIRDMTLHNAQSFGSFHLLRLMFDDYVLYLVEYVQIDEQIKQFIKLIPNNEPPIFIVFYFNDYEMPSQTVCPQLEYDTVSSSTGDFGDNHSHTQSNCNHNNETITANNQNDSSVLHNYSYQNSFQYHQSAIYNSHIDQQNRPNNYSWYSSTTVSPFEFNEQNPQNNCTQSAQLITSVSEPIDEISSASYSVDTTSLIPYNNGYDRQV